MVAVNRFGQGDFFVLNAKAEKVYSVLNRIMSLYMYVKDYVELDEENKKKFSNMLLDMAVEFNMSSNELSAEFFDIIKAIDKKQYDMFVKNLEKDSMDLKPKQKPKNPL